MAAACRDVVSYFTFAKGALGPTCMCCSRSPVVAVGYRWVILARNSQRCQHVVVVFACVVAVAVAAVDANCAVKCGLQNAARQYAKYMPPHHTHTLLHNHNSRTTTTITTKTTAAAATMATAKSNGGAIGM